LRPEPTPAPAPAPVPEPATATPPPALAPEPEAPPPPKKPRPSQGVKIASPGINAVNIDPKLVEFYAEHLEQRLGYAGVKVISPKEVGALIGLERQRELLGCNEGTSCIAEIAGALGVDGVLMGSLAKVGDTFQLNLKVVDAADASVLCTYAVRTDEEEALLKQLSFGAKD